jgi:hypothetical protein
MSSGSSIPLPPPPVFGMVGGAKHAKVGAISLDDIFEEFAFSAPTGGVSKLGGAIDDGDDDDDDESDGGDYDGDDGDPKRRKRPRGLTRNMTEEQKVERRYMTFLSSSLCDP